MSLVHAIGALATVVTSVSFLPQVIRAYKTKSTNDISMVTMSAYCFGMMMWCVYAMIISDMVVFTSGILSLIMGFALLWAKALYDK